MVADEGEDIGRSYIIMSYIPGTSLGSVWHLASDEQRENLINRVAKNLQVINKIDPEVIGADKSKSWEAMVRDNSNRLLGKLIIKNIFDETTIKKTREAIAYYSEFLADSEQCVVFWDIHFDNFIVNQNFELRAIIDLESTELTALDYPLFVLQKMTDKPHRYLREDEEKFADIHDYAKLKSWYRKYYPEMFEFKNLDKRLQAYQLCDVLHLLQDWSYHKETQEELQQLIM